MSLIKKFAAFNLSEPILTALSDCGYETPSPIQTQSIPILLEGHDLIAQAQTGTGKTAAFALPILEKLNLKKNKPQALILTPTRELAIQVSESFQSYAKHLPDFHITPIYGGQEYRKQLRALKHGVHVVVGTPGRVMDHMRRGTLSLENIRTLVLDEADEMLRTGFLEDVKWVLKHIPHKNQGALFSATMPASIQQVAKMYLNHPKQVKIKATTLTAASISQYAMLVSDKNKLEALIRYLEVENFDGAIVFTRTKHLTSRLAEKLAAHGYLAAALHGDMSQNLRENVIERLKQKSLDIVVATDVAARGLDVKRLSHVINYDAPYDTETYVNRIGRTGRAGSEGKSLLIITPREQHYLNDIKQATNQVIQLIVPPTIKELGNTRVENFIAYALRVLEKNQLDYYRQVVGKIAHQSESSELDIAAALLKMAQKDQPLQVKGEDKPLLDPNDKAEKRKKKKRRYCGNRSNRRFESRRRPRTSSKKARNRKKSR